MLCTEEVKLKYNKLFTVKVIEGDACCEGTVSISRALKGGLLKLLDTPPVIILTVLFCRVTTKHGSVLHYQMEICEVDHSKCVCITRVVHKSNSLTGST
jgi:hypothetical protein